MAPKKDSKSAAKKGKAEEPKKGGKDDKKGGKKAEEPKGKGKDDGKKGKGKKPVSESEEEEEEESSEMKTEDETAESEEEVVTKKGQKDKGKGKAALKGASKAVAVKGGKSPKRSSPEDEEIQQQGKSNKKGLSGLSDVQIKGASKAMMGASKAISGLAGKSSGFGMPKLPDKAKPKRNLKSTSRLFLRLSKKKKPSSDGKPLLGATKLFSGFGGKSGDKKPGLSGFTMFNKKDDASKDSGSPKKTVNLSKLGGQGKLATEAKGLGGKFKGMFGKKKPEKPFKTKGWMVGRMAAATNWLTGRFLTSKGQGRIGGRAGRHGRKNPSLANRGTRGKHTYYYNEPYEYNDGYGYEDNYQDRWGPSGRQATSYDPYDPYEEEFGYDDEEWEDEYGYYDDEGNYYYDDELYYDDDVDEYGYPYSYYNDGYEDYYGNEGVEYYYGEDGMLYAIEPEPFSYYDEGMHGFYDPSEVYEEFFDPNLAYNFGMSDAYGMMNGTYPIASGLYNDPMLQYAQPVPVYNPYQQHFPMNAGLDPVDAAQLYAQEQMAFAQPELISMEQFKVPRPQVMLYGTDRLEVETLPPPPNSRPGSPMIPQSSPVLALNNQEIMPNLQYEQTIPVPLPTQLPYQAVMNEQNVSIFPGQVAMTTDGNIQQEYLPSPQSAYTPLAIPPSQLPPSTLPPQFSSQAFQAPFQQEQQLFQMQQMAAMTPAMAPGMTPTMAPGLTPTMIPTMAPAMTPAVIAPAMTPTMTPLMASAMTPTMAPPVQSMIYSPLHSPVSSPMPVRRMSPFSSPQLSMRPGSVRSLATHSPYFSPHPMDFQSSVQMDPHFSPRLRSRRAKHRASMAGPIPTSSVDWQKQFSPPSSPPQQRRGMSIRTQSVQARGRGGNGLRRPPLTARPQSPLSSPLPSPRESFRRRYSPPASPRLSFRQQPPPDAVPLPPARPNVFKGRRQTSEMRHSPSPTLPSPHRRSPSPPERSQSPPHSFRPASPRRTPSPSPSRVTARPLPTRSSTRRMRGSLGGRSHVPMGAVKPSPANPYLQRRTRHGPPVTQHVAPFRTSIHSGSTSPSGQIGTVAGTPMLARAGSRPMGLRETKRIGTGQGGFHRPVGRGQPLVRMSRNQPSLHSRQSFRAPSIPPQSSLKQNGPLSSQPSIRRFQSGPASPQSLRRASPLPSRSASPGRYLSHPPSPLPHRAMSPHSMRQTSFEPPMRPPSFPPGAFPHSQSIAQYDYILNDPGPSPMLTNAFPGPQVVGAPFPSPLSSSMPYGSPLQRPTSPQLQHEGFPSNLPQCTPPSPNLGRTLQNPYLKRSPSPIPAGQVDVLLSGQDAPGANPYALGLPNALMHSSQLSNASYSFPLQRNASLYTNVLSPSQEGAPLASSGLPSPHLSSSLLDSQLRNASFTSPFPRQLSPTSSVPLVPAPTIPQQGGIRGSSLFSGGLRTSQIQGSMFKLPSGTLTRPQGVVETPATNDGVRGGILSTSALSNALQNPSLRKATYRLPDGSLITRNEPVVEQSPVSSSMLSSALLNPNMRKGAYKLPDGTLVMRSEPAPTPGVLSSALLNANVRKASYRLPDGSFLSRPGEEPQSAESAVASPGLSGALMNANLRQSKFQLPGGSSLFSRNQPQAPTSPLLSGALINPNLRGASLNLSASSLLRKPGSAETSGQRSLDLSNALSNKNLRSASYRLPDGTLMTRNEATSGTKSLDLSNALSKNPNLRGANFRLPDGNIMTRLGAPSTPQARSLNLSGALQGSHLKGANFRLSSSYAVVSPQVQGSGPDQHWAHGSGAEMQHGLDVWGSERVLPHGTVQNLNKWSMYRDGELLEPHGPMGQGDVGPQPGEWNLDREGEPKGQWFDKMYTIRSMATVSERAQREEDGVEDMTQLEEMHEGAVLLNLRKRFEREIIYTYIGSILVSVNPYRMYNIYGTDMVLLYKGCALGENPPHLFAIANAAYFKMMDAKHNQVIIISGESGSGKTEATKLVLRYLAAIHHRSNIAQQIEILEAAPLLESFGNAKTVRNDNSSRFGKYIEVFVEDGVISGAITSQYLLEKSRIVFQAKDERNYHIFYEMLAGLPSQQKQAFYLQDAETYYYLNQGGDYVITGKNDADDFRRLLSAMEILHFTPEDQLAIFRVLSSILHLGNVYFQRHEADGQEVASVVSAQEIRVVAELLQISPEGLQKAITFKVTETMRDKIYTPLSVESAVDARDAVAKILYSLVFHWLTERINAQVYPRQHTLSISILDIYGFEELAFNSFEQLCINYANEYLQFFFNRIVFREEQEEYSREQIPWHDITFSDNQPCIDLISSKPHGILRILDDQSCFPQATDHTFLQKCHYHHGHNPLYQKPKMPLPEFTIKHFAGRVTYQVYKFLDKNYDQVRQDVLDLFIQSRNKMVSNLFVAHAELTGQQRGGHMRKSSSVTRKYQPSTVSSKFQQSLLELVEKMERCNPYFVRCIKPNTMKQPGAFEDELVSNQLRHSGVLETIRIRKEGYPVRMTFFNFLFRYKSLVGIRELPTPNEENCIILLSKLCPLRPGIFYVGVSKLFLKEDTYQLLECKRERSRELAALTLQRYTRMFFVRKRFVDFRMNMIKFEAHCRGYLVRKHYVKMRANLVRFRSLVHMYVNRKQYIKMRFTVKRKAEEERRKRELELSRREVVNVTHLVIPAELGGLLQAAGARRELHSDCLALLQAPHIQEEGQLPLPLDINNFPFYRYVQVHFREPKFGLLMAPLESPLTRLEDDLQKEALELFNLLWKKVKKAADHYLQINGDKEKLEVFLPNLIPQLT